MAAPSECEWAMQFASNELRNNHAFVMAAVANNPLALQFAFTELNNNHEVTDLDGPMRANRFRVPELSPSSAC